MMSASSNQQISEWLVTDRRGAFAMGTNLGTRSRKYHGFLMGIPGRAQLAALADLDWSCDGIPLWPHSYRTPQGVLVIPDPKQDGIATRFELTNHGPRWSWKIPGGKILFEVSSSDMGGIVLRWTSDLNNACVLRIRGLWAMRDLHSLGGLPWTLNEEKFENEILYSIETDEGESAFCLAGGRWAWVNHPIWYHSFVYSEELARGYAGEESLFSAGIHETELEQGASAYWHLTFDASDLLEGDRLSRSPRQEIFDYTLDRPAGVVAGFPWFGEWGRDTFVALPGIAAVGLKENPDRIWNWAREVLQRWGHCIRSRGMLPNFIEKDEVCQWDSADSTLWWCHSLAALWAFSLSSSKLFVSLQTDFSELLDLALESIRQGRHNHLLVSQENLISVTLPYGSWMDARVDGKAVSPRTGELPEINALWFQALCLQWFWSQKEDFSEIEILGRTVLQRCREPSRPNRIFMHSLPLAPSFILNEREALENELLEIIRDFWTPVGLKTLRSSDSEFHSKCVGNQTERDLSYHQGPVWAWLGGHFEMARNRLGMPHVKVLERKFLPEMPVKGHLAELFDAEPPYTARGAPAQAWSEACLEEARARRRMKVDSKVSGLLAKRWLGRKMRRTRSQDLVEEAE